jgi:hypothetical protein
MYVIPDPPQPVIRGASGLMLELMHRTKEKKS